jgi:DNA-binding transcriptional LysR family regulator
MELRQLSAFVAVAEEGAFTRAATRLGVVQPAVSQAVRRLEEEIGIALVERSSRRVALTAAGEAFLPHARAVLARMAEAERAAAELASGRAGTVRLATAEGAAEVVAAIIARHRAAHPDVRVELRAPRSPKLHAVLGGEVDAALVHTAPRTPGLAFTEVSSEPWRAVASARHPLAGNGPVALAALARDPLVLVGGEGTPRLREAFLALLRGRASSRSWASPSRRSTTRSSRSPAPGRGRSCARPTSRARPGSASSRSRWRTTSLPAGSGSPTARRRRPRRARWPRWPGAFTARGR